MTPPSTTLKEKSLQVRVARKTDFWPSNIIEGRNLPSPRPMSQLQISGVANFSAVQIFGQSQTCVASLGTIHFSRSTLSRRRPQTSDEDSPCRTQSANA